MFPALPAAALLAHQAQVQLNPRAKWLRLQGKRKP